MIAICPVIHELRGTLSPPFVWTIVLTSQWHKVPMSGIWPLSDATCGVFHAAKLLQGWKLYDQHLLSDGAICAETLTCDLSASSQHDWLYVSRETWNKSELPRTFHPRAASMQCAIWPPSCIVEQKSIEYATGYDKTDVIHCPCWHWKMSVMMLRRWPFAWDHNLHVSV